METRTVSFRYFWPGFESASNYFVGLLRDHSPFRWVVVGSAETSDLCISSVFPFQSSGRKMHAAFRAQLGGKANDFRRLDKFRIPRPNHRARRNVWYTGENLRAPCDGWDMTLSFETDEYGGTNAYLPLWVLYWPTAIRWKVPEELTNGELRGHRLLQSDKQAFCNAFFGNPEPFRLRVLRLLRSLGQTDLYGSLTGTRVADKLGTSSRYWFSLCPESDLFPGYVTEKPLEAWLSRSIPIWWGIDPAGYLNPDCLINIADYSLEGLAGRLHQLAESKEQMERMIEEPFLKRPFSNRNIATRLTDLVS